MFFKTKKIINDPVYGIINLPDGIIFDILSHKYFQRLRRISQLGLSHFVYPGAIHTRFHHAIGALHLSMESINLLVKNGVSISEEEATALCLAILLHDIGHGPFSHVLEHTITGVHHEVLSLAIMEKLNSEFDGQLDTTIAIFKDEYHRPFFHQLVSGQLDLDRMDYLNRDSFFTGVAEGKIGYDRIIKMMTVKDEKLVIQQKGIYSVENFLMARRLMYWQVYLHKTVLAVEQMFKKCLQHAINLYRQDHKFNVSEGMKYFMSEPRHLGSDPELINQFLTLDDYDLWWSLKQFEQSDNVGLKYLSGSILNRNIFKIELSKNPFSNEKMNSIKNEIMQKSGISREDCDHVVFEGSESNEMYNTSKDEIMVLLNDGEVLPFSQISDYPVFNKVVEKYFLCYPKL